MCDRSSKTSRYVGVTLCATGLPLSGVAKADESTDILSKSFNVAPGGSST
jgi:hypothetical protein